jgi:hypothetical protein
MVQQLANDELVLTSTASTGPDHVKGTVTVAIGNTTRYREPGIRNGGPSAIVQGDVVAVRAKRDSNGNLQALEVTLPLVRARGFVATSVAGSFTLTGTGTTLGRAWGGKDLTVNLGTSTRYVEPESDRRGAPKSPTGPLALGSKVTVVGTQDGYATLNALRVLVLPDKHPAGRGHGDANHGNAKKGSGDAGHGGRTTGRGHPSRDS